jgi:hypothetical protein
MNNSGIQRIVPIALVLIVIIVAIAALVSLGRGIFGSGSTEPVVDTGQEALLNTAFDRSVRLTVRGPIVADEKFHSYTITAAPTTRVLTTYEGYLDRQVESTQLANNNKAYEEFVHALDRADLMAGKPLEGEENDIRGICATGRVYEYEVLQASNVVKRLWTTSCGKTKGSLQAANQSLTKLFQAQIPDATKMTSKVGL